MAPRLTIVSDVVDGAGGLEILQCRLASELARIGWDVTLRYRRGGDLLASWAAFARLEPVADVDADTFSGADVAYVHEPWAYVPAAHAARRARIPLVVHLHLPPDHVRTGWRSIRGRVGTPVQPELRDGAVASWIAVSHDTARLWEQAGLPRGSIEVVHNGLDPTRFHPDPDDRLAVRDELGIAPDDVVVGYVGRIDEHKGVDLACEAVVRLRSRHPRARLVIVGEETRFRRETGDSFASDLRARHAGPEFCWLGRRSDTDRLYRAFDVAVVPSRWREPFGLVVIEAMASGVPVVGTRRGGIPEILAGPLAAWCVPPSARRLSAAIDDVLAHDRVETGSVVRRRVLDEFTIEVMASRVDRALRRVLG